MSYQYLTVERRGAVEFVTLNRPDVRNAFNEHVIAELTAWAANDVPIIAALNAVKGEAATVNRRRGWADDLEPALVANGVDGPTLDAMQQAVVAALPDFRRYLSDRRVTLPVYEDPRGELEKAVGKWGTPAYYVLDGDGRARFGPLRSSHLTRVPALLALLAEGHSNESIARLRHLSERTVESHVASIFRALGLEATTGVNRRVQAAVAFLNAHGGPVAAF